MRHQEISERIFKMFSARAFYARAAIIVAVIFLIILGYLNAPSAKFPANTTITVEAGESLKTLAKDLKDNDVIRSTTLFEAIAFLVSGDKKVVAGDYYFIKPISDYQVVSRLINGRHELLPVRITIPEGLTMKQMVPFFSNKLLHFSATDFLKNATSTEGYLFPDTYFFLPDVKASDVIEVMHRNYLEHIESLADGIKASGRSEKDILIMASILEEEGQNTKDWKIIAGILWKRIKMGMALQVDSTLGYVTDRASSELTMKDLKTNSPYNTYVKKGLPPTPISNPGIYTIQAALDPTSTPYLYYLSDSKNVIHYAATFAQHVANRAKYLQ